MTRPAIDPDLVRAPTPPPREQLAAELQAIKRAQAATRELIREQLARRDELQQTGDAVALALCERALTRFVWAEATRCRHLSSVRDALADDSERLAR